MPETPKRFERGLVAEASAQLKNLGLTPEMMKGSVLDIGAEDAVLAKYFHHKSGVKVTSVDREVTNENRDLVDKGDARNLPYRDEMFDIVIAHASVPNVFILMYSSEQPELARHSIENAVHDIFSEIIRVLKPGKRAYIAPLLFAENYESQRVLKEFVFKEIESLESKNITTKLEFIKTEVSRVNGEKTELYRLIIEKPIKK